MDCCVQSREIPLDRNLVIVYSIENQKNLKQFKISINGSV